jgi:hypothetical protein
MDLLGGDDPVASGANNRKIIRVKEAVLVSPRGPDVVDLQPESLMLGDSAPAAIGLVSQFLPLEPPPGLRVIQVRVGPAGVRKGGAWRGRRRLMLGAVSRHIQEH